MRKEKLIFVLMVAMLTALIVLTGCEGLDSWVTDNPTAVSDIQTSGDVIAAVAAPATGGLAPVVWGMISTLAVGLLAANRQLVAKKRAKAIQEINAHPSSPPVLDQLITPDAINAVKKLL